MGVIMKFLIGALLLVTTQAFACPDISGSFTCKYRNRISEREITKTETGFIVIADGAEQEYKTDGSITSLPENDSLKDAKFSSVCEGDTFVVNFTGTLMYEGAEIGKEVQKTVYQMKNDDLLITIKTKAKHVPLPSINFLCTRK